jgi:hypothetical protein
MVLMEAVQADPTTLPGFEHRTFLCPACHDIERRLFYAGASTPSAKSSSGSPAAGRRTERDALTRRAWGQAVEKVLSRQKALNAQTVAKRRPDRPSAVEKLRTGANAGKERPSTATTIDLVCELNRIWDDPAPGDKPLEPPPAPLAK